MVSLSNAIQHIKNEINPIPRARSIRNGPKPMRTTQQVWINRKIRIIKQSTTAITVASGDIYNALAQFAVAGDSAFVRVDGLELWNTTNATDTTNYVNATLGQSLFTGGGSGNGSILGPFEDHGSPTSAAGVGVDIPLTLTSTLTVTQGSVVSLITISPVPTGLSTTKTQTVVLDLFLKVSY